jgi:hypothetical protein
MISKKIKPEKSSFQELFVATWKIKFSLENVSVKDENRKSYPVLHLYMSIEGYIPQLADKIKAESSGGCSLRHFREHELINTRRSWESLGMPKGKLPSTTSTWK